MKKSRWMVNPHQAEMLIYNDISTAKLLDDIYPDETSRLGNLLKEDEGLLDRAIKQYGLPNEEWKVVEMPESNTPIIVSSLGRLLSTYRGISLRMVRLKEKEGIVVTDSANNVIRIEDVMEQAGFTYDLESILKLYKKTDYPVLLWPKYYDAIVNE